MIPVRGNTGTGVRELNYRLRILYVFVGNELRGREDIPELDQAVVFGHTLLHYGVEKGLGGGERGASRVLKLALYLRAWLLSFIGDGD